jgi:maltose O-acetyltransferase
MTEPLSPVQRLRRIPGLLRARMAFRQARAGWRVHVAGPLIVRNRGRLQVGDGTCFIAGIVPSELMCEQGALLEVGASVVFGYGVSIRAAVEVHIGDRSSLGAMVRVRDDDGLRRAPVRIGEDVWIAHGAIIEPGVTIGSRAVVGAGSVVTCDVPEGMMAIGNPARVLPLQLGAGAREGPPGRGPLTT